MLNVECLKWSMDLATPNWFTGMTLTLKETNISAKLYRLKIPTCEGRPVGY